jgi:hypothetical protein
MIILPGRQLISKQQKNRQLAQLAKPLPRLSGIAPGPT